MKTTSIILTDKQFEWLKKKCISISILVRSLIDEYIKKHDKENE